MASEAQHGHADAPSQAERPSVTREATPPTVDSLLASVRALCASAGREPHDPCADLTLDAIGVLARALELDRSDRFAALVKVGPATGPCVGCGSPTRAVLLDEARLPAAPTGHSREMHCIGCMLKELHALRAEVASLRSAAEATP